MPEHQNIEYKQSWRDEYLKWICGFANAQGGKIFIGMDDDGEVSGVEDYKKLMDEIPNKAVNYLGLVVDVNLHSNGNEYFIEIVVPESRVPISYHGAYHYRSGSTKQELKGIALHEFLLKKIGRTWDDIILENATIQEIDEAAVNSFLNAAIKCGRIHPDAGKEGTATLLKNLDLMTLDGKLKAAAILLFGKNTMRYFIHSYFKIGKFGDSDADLKFQDTIEGNVFEMVDRTIRLLKERYLVSPISYEGIQRIEKLEYPEAALREAVLNAIVHKDYTGTTIQLSVYDDRLMLWNPGKLPMDIPLGKLKEKHSSYPRNKHIAEVFFRSGYIESWGRGIEKMVTACREAELPEPVFEEAWGGVVVTFLKDVYTREFLRKLNLNDRQVKAVIHAKENGKMTNAIYQKINGTTRITATRDLKDLLDKNVFSSSEKKGVRAEYFLVRR
jgi:ATP-dependent DNA helicase RecG